jgi:hypothetical protein
VGKFEFSGAIPVGADAEPEACGAALAGAATDRSGPTGVSMPTESTRELASCAFQGAVASNCRFDVPSDQTIAMMDDAMMTGMTTNRIGAPLPTCAGGSAACLAITRNSPPTVHAEGGDARGKQRVGDPSQDAVGFTASERRHKERFFAA